LNGVDAPGGDPRSDHQMMLHGEGWRCAEGSRTEVNWSDGVRGIEKGRRSPRAQ
jgi:hypothetical protein